MKFQSLLLIKSLKNGVIGSLKKLTLERYGDVLCILWLLSLFVLLCWFYFSAYQATL